MSGLSVFITGATGCIGHYVLEALRESFPDATLHLLVRSPHKFKQAIPDWPNVVIHVGDMDGIDAFAPVLYTCQYIIHIATVWGYNLEHNIRVNKLRTLAMLQHTNPSVLRRVIYFSTASILTAHNRLNPAAETQGTPYVQSKYYGYLALKQSPFASKIITLFPTVVLGGSKSHPFSHISTGLLKRHAYGRWIRRLRLPGAFHFLHATDIARMVVIGLTHAQPPADMVLGHAALSFNDAFTELAAGMHLKKAWVTLSIPHWIIRALTRLLGHRIDSWARYCLRHPYFTYNTHHPGDFGGSIAYPTLSAVIADMPTD